MVSLSQLQDSSNTFLLSNSTNDFSTLSQTQRDEIINGGVLRRYSKDRPLEKLQTYTGTDSKFYTLPDSYEDGFSTIRAIEYPIESTPPDYIDDASYGISMMSTGKKLRFFQDYPLTGAAFWVIYTMRHTFDSNGDSEIPSCDLDALTYLSCALFSQALASFYATKSNNTLPNVEAVGYNTRTAEYSSLADKWMEKYKLEVTSDVTGVYGDVDFVQDSYWDRDSD